MTDFTGTAGVDVFNGTAGTDTFAMEQGGDDEVFGDDGDDTFTFGAALTADDQVDGGLGSGDLLSIAGDYSAGLVFRNSTFKNIETLGLGAGFDYDLTFRDGNLSGAVLINGSDLGAADVLTLDASADTDATLTVYGGDGDDILETGGGNDQILPGLGNDTVVGNAGVDTIQYNSNFFDAADFLDGGDGTDFLSLVGDYSGGLTITKDMINSIEVLFVGFTFSYDLTFANKANDGSLAINASGVQAGFSVSIDAHAENTGAFVFVDSQNNDTFIGGGGNDFCNLSTAGGKETIQTKGGLDTISLGANLTKKDKIDGGAGTDQINLAGDYSGGVIFNPSTIKNIETIVLADTSSYDLTLDDANIAAGATLTIQCNAFGVLDTLTLNAGAELDGNLNVQCGIGDDVVTTGALTDTLVGSDGNDIFDAGAGQDTLTGGLGADSLEGGANGDTFVYGTVAESGGFTHDTLVTFNFNIDKVDLASAVTGIDAAIAAGTLSAATFEGDLIAAVNSGNLAVDHAVLFTPNAGDLAGITFIVVERSGAAGYQAGQDLVLQLDIVSNIGSFSTGNFI